MADTVLDASALIALLRSEPGGDVVEAALGGAAMTTVNIAEVVDHYARHGAHRADAERRIRRLNLMIVDADLALALDAGMLFPSTRSAGLSLGDRFCLALAKRLDRTVLTADRAWTRVTDAIGIHVQLIR